tara:strand:- start:10582 stop:11145 length:564 start_codon:yes stop_codon:yes gene_type:complete
MILCDKDLRKAIEEKKIELRPFSKEQIGPSGIDVRIGYNIRRFKDVKVDKLNPLEEYTEDEVTELAEPEDGRFIIYPEDMILIPSLEWINMPNDLVARVVARHSFNRLGLVVVGNAGTIEPGFKGFLTIAVKNVGKTPVILYPEMAICKLMFENMSSCAKIPYGMLEKSKYQEQEGPTMSKLHLEKG